MSDSERQVTIRLSERLARLLTVCNKYKVCLTGNDAAEVDVAVSAALQATQTMADAFRTVAKRYIGEIELPPARPCSGCGGSLIRCYDATHRWNRVGAVACCPDCDHREAQ